METRSIYERSGPAFNAESKMEKDRNVPTDEAEPSRQGGTCTRRSTLASIALLPLFAEIGWGSDEENGPPAPAEASAEKLYAVAAQKFVDAYNSHDIERALSFFTRKAVLNINGGSLALEGQEEIGAFLAEYGPADEGAPVIVTHMVKDVSQFTGDGLRFQGRIFYVSRQALSGFPRDGLTLSIAFAFLCRFDEEARCTSCTAIFDWGPLLPSPLDRLPHPPDALPTRV